MVVAVGQLQLELDAAEERGRWVEDEPVDAGVERIGEAGAAVGVCRCNRDLLGAAEQLDLDSRRGPAGRGIEHVGRERGTHRENVRACSRWAFAISASSALAR